MKREIRPNQRPKVLITGPSLDEDQNVSGISSIVREMADHSDVEFVFFVAGKRDNEKFGIVWVIRQLLLPVRFLSFILARNVDIVHINTAFAPLAILRDFALTMIARFFGYPVLLHVHGGKFMLKEFDGIVLNWLAGEMLYAADRVLVLNEVEQNRLSRKWKGLAPEVLPNAVDTGRVASKAEPNAITEIVYLGRIDREKGLGEIRDACRAVSERGFDFRFKCYGAGPQTEDFTTAMEVTLGDRFEFGGVLRGDEKWEALAKADIFVLPSYFEGLPMSLLEAMAAKCVVIASDVGSVGSVIEDGVNGFLVDPRNSGQIADRLESLLTNKVNWESIRDRARKTIEERYSIQDYIGNLEQHYMAVLDPAVRGNIH